MAVATPFSCWGLVRGAWCEWRGGEEVEGGKGKGGEGVRKYLADLLPQNLGLDNHPLTVCRLPQRSREDTDVQFLHADPHAQILDARAKEELIPKERLHNRRDPRPQAGARRARPAMVRRGIDLAEEPVMRRGLDLMDFGRELDFGDGGVGAAEAVGPALGEDAADVGFEDGFDDGLGEGGGVGDDDGAEADVDDLLAVGARLRDEGGEFGGRRPGGGFVEEPVAGDADPVAVVEGGHDDAGAEVVEEGDLVGLHLVEVGAAQVELLLAPAVHLPGDGFPEDVVEHDVRDVVVCAAHLVFGDGEGVRVCARAGPGHGEGTEVGDSKGLGDVDACHGAWAFDEEVGILTSLPGGAE